MRVRIRSGSSPSNAACRSAFLNPSIVRTFGRPSFKFFVNSRGPANSPCTPYGARAHGWAWSLSSDQRRNAGRSQRIEPQDIGNPRSGRRPALEKVVPGHESPACAATRRCRPVHRPPCERAAPAGRTCELRCRKGALATSWSWPKVGRVTMGVLRYSLGSVSDAPRAWRPGFRMGSWSGSMQTTVPILFMNGCARDLRCSIRTRPRLNWQSNRTHRHGGRPPTAVLPRG